MDYETLGPAPCDEICAALGVDADFDEKNIAECRRYKEMLQKRFPIPLTCDAYFSIKGNSHDFGYYREIVICYYPNDEISTAFMLHVEGNLPSTWDDEEILTFNPEIEMCEVCDTKKGPLCKYH